MREGGIELKNCPVVRGAGKRIRHGRISLEIACVSHVTRDPEVILSVLLFMSDTRVDGVLDITHECPPCRATTRIGPRVKLSSNLLCPLHRYPLHRYPLHRYPLTRPLFTAHIVHIQYLR